VEAEQIDDDAAENAEHSRPGQAASEAITDAVDQFLDGHDAERLDDRRDQHQGGADEKLPRFVDKLDDHGAGVGVS
jgi:hypothetical protein